MNHSTIVTVVAALLLLSVPAGAAQSSLQIELGTGGDFERRMVTYDCAAEAPLVVTYLNAAPNFLALVPVAGEVEELVFAAVISASGVRYAAGQWIWWSQGVDASLYDATLGEDAEAVLTCTEINNTP
ncbi:MliC family protein [Devosia sp.]|uniref:MliC family protein n=1 Tax=Devosia sp. TaxID=1871048 RepID=UPI002FCC1583